MSTNVKLVTGFLFICIISLGGVLGYLYFFTSASPSVVSETSTTTIESIDDSSPTASDTVVVTDYRDVPSVAVATDLVVDNLDAPWAFAWLPNADMLITERFGGLQRVRDGVAQAVTGVPEVFSVGQGGLLDVTVHPNFENNQFVYLSYAAGNQESNRLEVARAILNENSLQNVEVLFATAENKTGSQHFGSRFAWLPDGTLLFSVGDGGNPPVEYNGALIREQAQNLSAHLGKIIRINDDGSVPDDNPFIGRPDVNPEIYSYGHRNSQGIVYDTVFDRVLASEHGSKGGDELNQIVPGSNYGWPLVSYSTEYDAFSTAISPDTTLPGMTDPLATWTPTIAPSSVVVQQSNVYGVERVGDIFLAAMLLRSNSTIAAYVTRPAGALINLEVDDAGAIVGQRLLTLGDVRVRSVAMGPDGYLYALTDTTSRQTRPGTGAGAIVRLSDI